MVAKFNGIYLNQVEGFELTGTADGIAAGWQILNRSTIDLVLLDIYMNQENGLQLLVDLRKMNYPADVIVISSANDPESIQTALRYGAVDYLIKPFDFERFQEALLQYKLRREGMQKESLRQTELDALFHSKLPNKDQMEELLPKGITKETYHRVLRDLTKLKGWFSTAELSDVTGISRVSLRKYLRFLEEGGLLQSDISYEGSGRPFHKYKLSTGGRDYVLSVINKED
ncbi:response regulator [Bacillus horti]|nr:response regulator [Bacillus horti]